MNTWKIVTDLLALLVVLLILGWIFWKTLKKSDDPKALLAKWAFTLVMLGVFIRYVIPLALGSPFIGVPVAAACGVVVSIVWAPSWGSMLASPLTGLFDGGSEEIEAKALYSKAISLRNRSQFRDAVAEIRLQLEKFPADFSGHLLLAEIQAENLNDLQGAQTSIHKIINACSPSPAQIAGAFHALADWHLKFGQDPDSARLALEKIGELLPGTQFSQLAAQRIGHLASVDQLLETLDRPKLVLGHYEKNIGITKQLPKNVNPSSDSPAAEASRYVEHLKKHPLDTEAREKLAVIYAEHYQRLDLAEDQLQQLVSQPQQPAKQVARWLNLLADLQIKIGNNIPAAEKTLRRIQELLPRTSYAEQAAVRFEYLRLEAKRNEKSQAMKLGSYEKDLGLKKSIG